MNNLNSNKLISFLIKNNLLNGLTKILNLDYLLFYKRT